MDYINFLLDNKAILIGVGALLLFVVVMPAIINSVRDKDELYQEELFAYEEQLEKDILAKEERIKMLEYQINDMESILAVTSTAVKNDLTPVQNKALDLFESQGIRISTDIIEELIYSRINDLDNAISFINAQRSQWKLENSKKLFKVVK